VQKSLSFWFNWEEKSLATRIATLIEKYLFKTKTPENHSLFWVTGQRRRDPLPGKISCDYLRRIYYQPRKVIKIKNVLNSRNGL